MSVVAESGAAHEFPLRHLPRLRCPFDTASLRLTDSGAHQPEYIADGGVQCTACQRQYSIARGVLRLLSEGAVSDAVAAHEQKLWDSGAAEYDTHVTYGRQTLNAIEIPATLEALGTIRGKVILELGCGTGRISTLLVPACRELVAVDFSANELAILAHKLDSAAPVSLVQADVTQALATPRSFDLILSSQVVQALPTREHRMGMFRWAAEALADNGRFVFTTYHHGLRNRIFGIAQSARYTHGGIYRYYSTVAEIKREVAPYFRRVRIRPIQVAVPGLGRLGISEARLSRIAERIPGVRQFGILLLVEGRRPIRPPHEGLPSMAVEGGMTLLRRRLEAARKSRREARRS